MVLAAGAGLTALYLASGSDSSSPAPVAQLPTVDVLVAKSDIGLGQTVTLEPKPEQTETLARARQSGTLSLALRSIVDVNAVETSPDDSHRRGETVNVIRYGVANQAMIQK